jgi:serpin B
LPLTTISAVLGKDVIWNKELGRVEIYDQKPISTPDGDTKDISSNEVSTTINEFDFSSKLMKYMPQDQNYMFSPFSIKMALAMVTNGAEGKTKDELLKTLGINNIEEFNKEAQSLMETINKDQNVKFNIANSIWLNTGDDASSKAKFNDQFNDIISKYYFGEAAKVNNENAVKTINDWISKKTENRIKDVIPDNKFTTAIVNTIYFKGKWSNPFKKEATIKKEFTDIKGQKSQIDFMNNIDHIKYFEDEGSQVIALPYKGDKISMYICLPKEKDFIFDSSYLEKAVSNMNIEKVNLSIPKFKTEFGTGLKDILIKMGIVTAFSNKAQFSKVLDGDSLKISSVIHKTFIDVNEEETEAAAATAIMMRTTAFNPTVKETIKIFNANHSFMYFIKNEENGKVMFMGEYKFTK